MIKINDTYYIVVNDYGYKLVRQYNGKTKDKTPKVAYETIGYYNDIKKAIHRALSDAVHRGLAEKNRSLSEAIAVINEITESFKKSLDEKIKQDV